MIVPGVKRQCPVVSWGAHYSAHELGQPFGLPKERLFGISAATLKVPLDGTGVERRKVWRGPEMQRTPIQTQRSAFLV